MAQQLFQLFITERDKNFHNIINAHYHALRACSRVCRKTRSKYGFNSGNLLTFDPHYEKTTWCIFAKVFNTLTQTQQKESRSFRLAQISDCHLSASPDTPYRGVSSDAGLASVVKAVAGWRADAVMLTGDLSEDGSEASYRRLAELIAPLNVPICALPGNHDVPELMQQYFPYGPYQGACMQQAGGWKLLLLNSARPRRIDGCIDPGDLLQVAQYLQGDSPAILALHHQPVVIGSAWIDKYRLDQPDDLLACVADHPQIKAVVWGHVHQAFEAQIGSARFRSAPSSAANSLPASPQFTLDPAGPAFRWMELFIDGQLETGILHATG